MKPANAQTLYGLIKEKKFKNILELGTGIGAATAVCSLALEGTDGHVDTIEQDEKCYKIAVGLIPEELKFKIEFFRTDVDVWSDAKMPYQHFLNFKELPDKEYDFIIVDGPGETLIGDDFVNLPNGDVLKLLMADKLKPGTHIFFDGRIKALGTLERYYSDNFYTLEAVNNRCNVLERKDNPVKFRDTRKESFERDGYFS